MNPIFSRLKKKNGETLTEVLVTLLVVVLAAGLLAAIMSSAARINAKANRAIDTLYQELANAEQQLGKQIQHGSIDLTIDGITKTVPVTYYFGEAADSANPAPNPQKQQLISYEKE